MINKVTMYAAKCDNCGDGWSNHDGICAYPDKDCMEEQLRNDEWHTEKGEPDKHYCPSCWFMDDDDKIQLKQKENP